MKKPSLTSKSFESLLAWLDADREVAGEKYEEIHFRLTKLFARRGCHTPEELADETIDRVMRKAPELAGSYLGDPRLYFYGVAKNVFLEYVRKRPPSVPAPAASSPRYLEQHHLCLDKCLGELSPDSRHFILRYYEGDKGDKIARRKELADLAGITAEALRTRAARVKRALHLCIKDCLAQSE